VLLAGLSKGCRPRSDQEDNAQRLPSFVRRKLTRLWRSARGGSESSFGEARANSPRDRLRQPALTRARFTSASHIALKKRCLHHVRSTGPLGTAHSRRSARGIAPPGRAPARSGGRPSATGLESPLLALHSRLIRIEQRSGVAPELTVRWSGTWSHGSPDSLVALHDPIPLA
jgi:hypothetical protein